MKIDIITSANNINKEKIEGKTVIIIDILRATSVIVTAINNGCNKVIPVLTVKEALELAKHLKEDFILGGERNALKIDGFNYSNSPLDYTKNNVKNKTLIITTTNGTKAIHGCINAKNILIGAMINGKFVANKAIELNNDLVIVNSGTNGEFSIDDFICSGYIIDCIINFSKGYLTDIAKTAHYVYKMNTNIPDFIKNSKHYNTLKELGLNKDLEYCCKKDIINVVPEFDKNMITK